MTPLTAADGQVYAVAQGSLSVGGFAAGGESASVSKNHPTVGRIPDGATVEKEELATFVERGHITPAPAQPGLHHLAAGGEGHQRHLPQVRRGRGRRAPSRCRSRPRPRQNELLAFLDRVCNLEVEVDSPAIVVINERTGTVIVGEKVTISAVAISHGSISIVTQEKDLVSQPQPFSKTGTTEKVHRTDVSISEQKANMILIPARRWRTWPRPSTRWARRRGTSSPSSRRSARPGPSRRNSRSCSPRRRREVTGDSQLVREDRGPQGIVAVSGRPGLSRAANGRPTNSSHQSPITNYQLPIGRRSWNRSYCRW